MIGIVVRFDMRSPESAAQFDDLTQEVMAAIVANEPGTIVYATQSVIAQPLARVFYEIYADKESLQAHEDAPHVLAFHARKEALLSAPSRIEYLTLGPAKGLAGAALGGDSSHDRYAF